MKAKKFYKFKPVGISLDCSENSCHSQCIYITIARVKAHLRGKNIQQIMTATERLRNRK